MAVDQSTENRTLKETVRSLSGEVLRLQKELGDLHSADVNALRRAYRSVCQHIEALEQESQGLEECIRNIETELITPEDITNEVGYAGAVCGLFYGINKAMLANQIQSVGIGWIAGVGIAFVTAHALWNVGKRVVSIITNNADHKRHLLQQWKLVQERVVIMDSLRSWSSSNPLLASEGGALLSLPVMGTPAPSREASSAIGAADWSSSASSGSHVATALTGQDASGRVDQSTCTPVPSAPPLPEDGWNG